MDALLLIKHAMPEIVADVPPAQWLLGEGRRTGAEQITSMLAPYGPTRMFTSTEPKARETGTIIAHGLGIPCEQRVDFHEHERPDARWMGQDAFHAIVARFFEHPVERVLSAETAHAAAVRFGRAMDQLLAAYPTDSLAVTAHGTVMSLYVAERTAVNPFSLWRRLGLPSFVALSRPDLCLLDVVGGGGSST